MWQIGQQETKIYIWTVKTNTEIAQNKQKLQQKGILTYSPLHSSKQKAYLVFSTLFMK